MRETFHQAPVKVAVQLEVEVKTIFCLHGLSLLSGLLLKINLPEFCRYGMDGLNWTIVYALKAGFQSVILLNTCYSICKEVQPLRTIKLNAGDS